MLALPDVRTRPVTSLVRSDPLFCDPDTPIHDAAQLLMDAGRSAILVRTRDGLGIVTDVDFRDKVVVGGIPSDAPVARIMTSPVHTIGAEVLAPEASIAMMVSGVNHLPVLDTDGNVVGILSASNLMALDARSPFALRRALSQARDVDELAGAAQDIPRLFVDLLDANLDAPALTRILTVLCDTMTARLLEIAIDEHGEPPVPYAWLAFGSCARTELTLASDQDNGLAYDDTDDPSVDEYFRLLAVDVNAGLARCGFAADPHGVLARTAQWRMPLSKWKMVFAVLPRGQGPRPAGARQRGVRLPAGRRRAVHRQGAHRHHARGARAPALHARPAPARLQHPLAAGLPRAARRLRRHQEERARAHAEPGALLGLHARHHGRVDARAPHRRAEIEGRDPMNEDDRSLREAFTSMLHLQLRHHANAIRNGRPLDNIIDTSTLRPLDHANLQEALRLVAAEQKRFPFLPRL